MVLQAFLHDECVELLELGRNPHESGGQNLEKDNEKRKKEDQAAGSIKRKAQFLHRAYLEKRGGRSMLSVDDSASDVPEKTKGSGPKVRDAQQV